MEDDVLATHTRPLRVTLHQELLQVMWTVHQPHGEALKRKDNFLNVRLHF